MKLASEKGRVAEPIGICFELFWIYEKISSSLLSDESLMSETPSRSYDEALWLSRREEVLDFLMVVVSSFSKMLSGSSFLMVSIFCLLSMELVFLGLVFL